MKAQSSFLDPKAVEIANNVTKMETKLFVSLKLIVQRLFIMFEFGATVWAEKCSLTFHVAVEIIYFNFLALSKNFGLF